jgi:protoporphyrinogen oxidase
MAVRLSAAGANRNARLGSHSPSPAVIIGAGITGLLIAALLRQRHPEQPVVIIERTAHVGGLYTSIDYGKAGHFDYGMHILYDTGIEEIDTLLHGLLPENEWHILEGNRKDIAGIFWNGRLQQHSPYIDLRKLPAKQYSTCLEGLYAASSECVAADAATYLTSRFGAPVASHLCAVIDKFYDCPANMVSYLATRQPTMDRVLLFDEKDMESILKSDSLKARIGYPDQLSLPPIRSTSQCGWYPRKIGMFHIINALTRRLQKQGVQFIFNAGIERIDCDQSHIRTLWINTAHESMPLENIDKLYWTAGWPNLAPQLGIATGVSLQGVHAAHIHLRFRRAPNMGELYHFYCFDSGYRIFRVTSYANYCPAARNELGYPVCVEYWPKESETPELYIGQALKELRMMGIVDNEPPSFSAIKLVPNYHRLFTLNTVQAIEAIRKDIMAMNIQNLATVGVLASSGELLSYEIMRDAYAKLH